MLVFRWKLNCHVTKSQGLLFCYTGLLHICTTSHSFHRELELESYSLLDHAYTMSTYLSSSVSYHITTFSQGGNIFGYHSTPAYIRTDLSFHSYCFKYFFHSCRIFKVPCRYALSVALHSSGLIGVGSGCTESFAAVLPAPRRVGSPVRLIHVGT
jgi:hypothetical protein